MKQIIKALTITVALAPSVGSCTGGYTSDPQTHALLKLNKVEIIKNLQEAKKHTDQFIAIRKEMEGVKDAIGYFKGNVEGVKNELSSWKNYYDKIDAMDADNFSAFSWLGLDTINPGGYTPNTTDAFNNVKNKLFKNKDSEQMEYDRQQIARNSISTGIVVSNENKSTLSDTKEKIYKTTEQSLNSVDVYDATIAQNKLLAIIASELTRLRELSAQQLEMQASFFSQ